MSKATENKEVNLFAERLRELIKEKGYTHEAVAKGVGVTRQGVGKWVSGDSVPDVLTAGKLADFFDVSVDYLAGNCNIKSVDMNLKTVCAYTGLNEEAIENIVNRTSMPDPVYDIYTKSTFNATIFTPQYYEGNKKVLNKLLSCSYFWEIVFQYMVMEDMEKISYNLQDKYNKACKKIIEGASSEAVYKAAENVMQNYNDIDVARYAVARIIEKISDIFDCRGNNAGNNEENTETEESQLPF